MAKNSKTIQGFSNEKENKGPTQLQIDQFRNEVLQEISKEHTELEKQILVVNAAIIAAASTFGRAYNLRSFTKGSIAEFYQMLNCLKQIHESIRGDLKFTIGNLAETSENLDDWLHAANQLPQYGNVEGNKTKAFLGSLSSMLKNNREYDRSKVIEASHRVLTHLKANQYDNTEFSYHCQEHIPQEQYALLWFLSNEECLKQVYKGIAKSRETVEAMERSEQHPFTLLDNNTQDIKDRVASIKAFHAKSFENEESNSGYIGKIANTAYNLFYRGRQNNDDSTLKDAVFGDKENIEWFTTRTQEGAERVAGKYDAMYLQLSSSIYHIRANQFVCIKIANDKGVDAQICNIYSHTLNNLIKLTSDLPLPFFVSTRDQVKEMENIVFEENCKDEQCVVVMNYGEEGINVVDASHNKAFDEQNQRMLQQGETGYRQLLGNNNEEQHQNAVTYEQGGRELAGVGEHHQDEL